MARSIECRCEYNFTCGYCLRNAKPYHFTLNDGTRIYQLPAFISQPKGRSEEADDESRRSQHG